MVTEQDMQKSMSPVELSSGVLVSSFNYVWMSVSRPQQQQQLKDIAYICVGSAPTTQAMSDSLREINCIIAKMIRIYCS